MVVQASFAHELIYQNPVVIIEAISNKFDQIWVTELNQVMYFILQHFCMVGIHYTVQQQRPKEKLGEETPTSNSLFPS